VCDPREPPDESKLSDALCQRRACHSTASKTSGSQREWPPTCNTQPHARCNRWRGVAPDVAPRSAAARPARAPIRSCRRSFRSLARGAPYLLVLARDSPRERVGRRIGDHRERVERGALRRNDNAPLHGTSLIGASERDAGRCLFHRARLGDHARAVSCKDDSSAGRTSSWRPESPRAQFTHRRASHHRAHRTGAAPSTMRTRRSIRRAFDRVPCTLWTNRPRIDRDPTRNVGPRIPRRFLRRNPVRPHRTDRDWSSDSTPKHDRSTRRLR
jgi:hypothetical protein